VTATNDPPTTPGKPDKSGRAAEKTTADKLPLDTTTADITAADITTADKDSGRKTPIGRNAAGRLLSPSAGSERQRSSDKPPTLSIDVERDGSTAVLKLRGELDLAAADELRRCIRTVLTQHDPHRLLLDLAELTFTDSMGLAVFVWAHKELARRNRQLRLYHPHRQLRRILYITGLDTRLHITDEK
jgi:anti-anti-sigma factor